MLIAVSARAFTEEITADRLSARGKALRLGSVESSTVVLRTDVDLIQKDISEVRRAQSDIGIRGHIPFTLS